MHFNDKKTSFKKHVSLVFSMFFYSLLLPKLAIADIDERYHLSIGTTLEIYNTELGISSGNQTKNNEFNLEDDLGFDSRDRTLWIDAWYRVGDLHRIRMTYTPLARSAQSTSFRDVIIDGTTIKAGAEFSSKTQTDILDFSYIYSVHKTSNLEVGLSLGLYWLFYSSTIKASGQIQAENEDQPSFQQNYLSNQNLQAPMPLIGASAIYEISSNWRTHASIRVLSVQINEIEGSISSAEIGAEYYFHKNWGAGLSVNYFDLQADIDLLLTKTTFNWARNGVQAYISFKY